MKILNNKLFVFAHIPKTGGTSLRAHFQKHLVNHEQFVHLSEKGDNDAIKHGLLPFNMRDNKEVKVILGHDVNKTTAENISNKMICRIVVFREPESWLISRYNQAVHERNQMNKEHLNFKDWIEKFPNVHSQFNWFTYSYLAMQKEAYNLSILERNNLILRELKEFTLVVNLKKLNNKIDIVMRYLKIKSIKIKKNVSKDRGKCFYVSNPENNKLLRLITAEDKAFFKKLPFT